VRTRSGSEPEPEPQHDASSAASSTSTSPNLEFHQRTKHSFEASSPKEEEDALHMPSVFFYEDYPNSGRPRLPHDGAANNLINTVLDNALRVTTWKSVQVSATDFIKWSLRVYPSSGALYGTEVYFVFGHTLNTSASSSSPSESADELAQQASGAPAPGGGRTTTRPATSMSYSLLHYDARDHVLRKVPVDVGTRAPPAPDQEDQKRTGTSAHGARELLGIAFTTIWQRQSYKYGERGLRYALLDVGHVLAAVQFALEELVSGGVGVGQHQGASSGRSSKHVPRTGILGQDVERFFRKHILPSSEEFVCFLDLRALRQFQLFGGEGENAKDEVAAALADGKTDTQKERLDGVDSSARSGKLLLDHDYYGSTFRMYDSVRNLTRHWRRMHNFFSAEDHEEEEQDQEETGRSTEMNVRRSPPRAIQQRTSAPESLFSLHAAIVDGRSSATRTQLVHDQQVSLMVEERRTAASFDRKAAQESPLPAHKFHFLLAATRVWAGERLRQKLLLFVHSVAGYVPGLYVWDTWSPSSAEEHEYTEGRQKQQERELRPVLLTALQQGDDQSRILGQNAACGQKLGGDGYFALAVLSADIAHNDYRDEHVRAGIVVHRLYLGAELLRINTNMLLEAAGTEDVADPSDTTSGGAAPVRASGMGCYVDEYFDELLLAGWTDPQKQKPLYMAAVGPVVNEAR